MTAGAERSGPRNFKDASPREARTALILEEQVPFDADWRAAMAEATEKQGLTKVSAP